MIKLSSFDLDHYPTCFLILLFHFPPPTLRKPCLHRVAVGAQRSGGACAVLPIRKAVGVEVLPEAPRRLPPEDADNARRMRRGCTERKGCTERGGRYWGVLQFPAVHVAVELTRGSLLLKENDLPGPPNVRLHVSGGQLP